MRTALLCRSATAEPSSRKLQEVGKTGTLSVSVTNSKLSAGDYQKLAQGITQVSVDGAKKILGGGGSVPKPLAPGGKTIKDGLPKLPGLGIEAKKIEVPKLGLSGYVAGTGLPKKATPGPPL